MALLLVPGSCGLGALGFPLLCLRVEQRVRPFVFVAMELTAIELLTAFLGQNRTTRRFARPPVGRRHARPFSLESNSHDGSLPAEGRRYLLGYRRRRIFNSSRVDVMAALAAELFFRRHVHLSQGGPHSTTLRRSVATSHQRQRALSATPMPAMGNSRSHREKSARRTHLPPRR